MKKLVIAAAFIAVSQIGFAQQKVDEVFKKDVLKLIELKEGGDEGMDKMMKDIPKEKQAAFTAEMNALRTSYREKTADIAMQVYTKEEVKELIAFYESPVHKKESEFAKKTKQVNVEYFTGMMTVMAKYQEYK